MPRNASGNYTLPAGNPVVSGTVISSTWANNTLPDLGNEITNSLSRLGEGAMLAALRNVNGTEATPSITFTNNIGSGLHLAVASPAEIWMNIEANRIMRWRAGGVDIWDNASASWKPLGNNFAGNDPDLVDTNAALVVSITGNPTVEQHLEIGPSALQSKSNTTTAAPLKVNTLGGNVTIGPNAASSTGNIFIGPTGINAVGNVTIGASGAGAVGNTDIGSFGAGSSGDTTIYLDGLPAIKLDDVGIGVKIFDVSSSPATVATLSFRSELDVAIGACGFVGSTTLQLSNFQNAQTVLISGRDTGGNSRTMMLGDPDGPTTIHYNGAARLATEATGFAAVRANDTSDTNTCGLSFKNSDVTQKGLIGYSGTNSLRVRNEINGGAVILEGETAGGVLQTLLSGVAGSNVNLLFNNVSVARTVASASGGLQANNTVTGTGFERVLTTSDLGVPTPPPVAGYVAGAYNYTHNDSDTTFLNVDLIAQNTWTEINPTGAGGVAWGALSALPTNTTSLKIAVQMSMTIAANAAATFTVYARNSSVTTAAGNQTRIAQWSMDSDAGGGMVGNQTMMIEVPVTGRAFDILWDAQSGAALTCRFALKGFTTT